MSIQLKNVTLDNTKKNKWFLTKHKELVEFTNATYDYSGRIIIFGSAITGNKLSLYEKPIRSSLLDIYKCNRVNNRMPKTFQIKDIYCKVFAIDIYENDTAFFPIIHSFDNNNDIEET